MKQKSFPCEKQPETNEIAQTLSFRDEPATDEKENAANTLSSMDQGS
jgi:hypothetical protein